MSESELNQLVQQIPLPTSDDRIRVHHFGQTNLFVYRDSSGNLGILLSDIGDSPEIPDFRNIQFRVRDMAQIYHSNDTSSDLNDVFTASFTEPRFDFPVVLILEYMLDSVDGDHYMARDLIDSIMLFKESLAGPPMQLSAEEKIGIWGELWFIRRSIPNCRHRRSKREGSQSMGKPIQFGFRLYLP